MIDREVTRVKLKSTCGLQEGVCYSLLLRQDGPDHEAWNKGMCSLVDAWQLLNAKGKHELQEE